MHRRKKSFSSVVKRLIAFNDFYVSLKYTTKRIAHSRVHTFVHIHTQLNNIILFCGRQLLQVIFEIEKSHRKSIDVTNKSLDEQEDLKKEKFLHLISTFNVHRQIRNFLIKMFQGKCLIFFRFQKLISTVIKIHVVMITYSILTRRNHHSPHVDCS